EEPPPSRARIAAREPRGPGRRDHRRRSRRGRRPEARMSERLPGGVGSGPDERLVATVASVLEPAAMDRGRQLAFRRSLEARLERRRAVAGTLAGLAA